MVKSDKGKSIYTLRAPLEFYESLGRCIAIRPDGEIVVMVPSFDHTNRFVSIKAMVLARSDGWKVRAARFFLGMS